MAIQLMPSGSSSSGYAFQFVESPTKPGHDRAYLSRLLKEHGFEIVEASTVVEDLCTRLVVTRAGAKDMRELERDVRAILAADSGVDSARLV